MTARHTLQDAIAAVRAGDMEHAQLLAIGIVRENPDDPNSWYLLSQLVDSDARRAAYLSRTLALDPNHARARIEFDALPPALVADLAPAAAVTTPEPAAEWDHAGAPDDEDTPYELVTEFEGEAVVDAKSHPGGDLPEWLQPLGAQQVAATSPAIPAEASPATVTAASRPKSAAPARKPAAKKKKKKNGGNQALSILLGLLALLTILVVGFLVYLLVF